MLLQAKAKFPDRLGLLVDVASALTAMHARLFMHRDIKVGCTM